MRPAALARVQGEIATEDLSPMLRELADLLGLPATLQLVRYYGGVDLYLPKNLPSNHDLVLILGVEAARRLIDHYGHGVLRLPLARTAMLRARDRLIIDGYTRGKTARGLAMEHGISERQVRAVLARTPEDDRQARLFDGEAAA